MTIEDRSAWAPVLTGALAEQAWDAIRAIARGLETTPAVLGDRNTGQRFRDPSLGNGDAGIALFFHYLAQTGDAGAAEQAARFLELAVDGVAELATTPELHLGFPGVAWVIEHVGADTEGLDEIDAAVAERVEELARGPIGLFEGLAGLGVYALERESQRAKQIVERIVELLAEHAERDGEYVTWFTRAELLPTDFGMRDMYPRGVHSFSIAHGVPGVISFLGAAYAANVARAVIAPLVDGAIRWLLAHALDDTTRSTFPELRAPNRAPHPARPAWCMGDPGIAATLACAAIASEQSPWLDRALAIARSSAARDPAIAAPPGIQDACLCHGAAGLGLVFQRLHHSSRDPILRDAAYNWYTRALAMRGHEGVGGFLRYSSHDDPPWVPNYSLTLGAAGIGLALLAAVTSIEPAWDRVMLLSFDSR